MRTREQGKIEASVAPDVDRDHERAGAGSRFDVRPRGHRLELAYDATDAQPEQPPSMLRNRRNTAFSDDEHAPVLVDGAWRQLDRRRQRELFGAVLRELNGGD